MSVLSKLLLSQKPEVGTFWENRALPTIPSTIDDQYGSIAGDNGKYVAVAGRGSVTSSDAAFSSNGYDWSFVSINEPPPSGIVNRQFTYDIGFGKDASNQDIFVIPSYNNNEILWSNDGRTFKRVLTLLTGAAQWYTIAYGNGRWVILSSNNNNLGNITIHSSNPKSGSAWTKNTTISPRNWHKVRFANSTFFAVSLSNNFAYSLNPSSTVFNSWVNRTFNISPNIPSPPQWRDVAFGDGKWVVVGHTTNTNNDLVIYGDPVSNVWNVAVLPEAAQWMSIVHTGKFFVAKAYFGPTAISVNGINWVKVPSVPTQGANFTRMVYAPNDNKILTTGFGGTKNNVWVSLPSWYNY